MICYLTISQPYGQYLHKIFFKPLLFIIKFYVHKLIIITVRLLLLLLTFHKPPFNLEFLLSPFYTISIKWYT